jgi:hypothetical protein
MIRDVYLGSRIRILIFTYPNSKGQKSTGSAKLVVKVQYSSLREFKDAGVEAKVWYKVGPDV